jgi:hypothetical protein
VLLKMWNDPASAVIQGLVEPRMGATASAFVFMLMNFVGEGAARLSSVS